MRSRVIFVCSVLLVARMAAASGNSLEDALNHQYKKQTYSLRHPVSSDSQRFDSSGKVLDGAPEGPWTIYGRLNIKKIKLTPGKLIIEGQRSGYRFDSRERKLASRTLKGSARLEIDLGQPLASADAANALLGSIFAFSKEDFLASVSPVWRSYLESYIETYSDDGRNLQFKKHADQKKGTAVREQQKGKAESGVYHVGNGVAAPVPISTPDPDYSDTARHAKFQATNVFSMVVDVNGRVTNLQILQPAGLGLDENSMQRLKTWTFHPATKDGQPVSVMVSVEVSFRLY